jgi:superfamily II DNA or RNA helicase
MSALRPYQQHGIDELRSAFVRGLKRICFKLPTGGGKTVIAEHIIRMATSKGKRVAFVCNRIELALQTSRRFAQAGIHHGLMQGENSHSRNAQVMICSIQTMARRKSQDFDLIIIDECHGVPGSDAYKNLIFSLNNVPVVGLTATPYSKGMARHYAELDGPLFQEVVVGATIANLIEDKFLVDVDIYAPERYQPDLSNVKIVAGDYDETELAEAVDKPKLVGDIVEHWKRLGRGKQTIVFATNIAHSKHICAMFNEAGIKAEHVDYRVTDEDRAAILDRVRNH